MNLEEMERMSKRYAKEHGDEIEERRRREEDERRGMLEGRDLIKPIWYEGEYLSGYMVHEPAASALAKLGLAHYVEGWGYHLDDRVVERLGREFRYTQAEELARPALEAAERKEREMAELVRARFEEARRSGQRVVLRSWTEECDDPEESCDLDIVTEYAMPDGTTIMERQHTW